VNDESEPVVEGVRTEFYHAKGEWRSELMALEAQVSTEEKRSGSLKREREV
jgi:hypothetical protein